MSLAEETARVAGGGKNTLKTMLQKLGVGVGSERMDQYPTLANQISGKLHPDNLISAATASSLGLAGTATPNEAFAQIKALIDAANANANTKCRIATGTYTGTGNYQVITIVFPFSPTFFAIPTIYWANASGGTYLSIPSVGNGDPFPIIVLSSFQQNVTRDVDALGYQATATYDPNTRTLTIRTGNSYNPNGAGSIYYWIAI